ncbi:hypothetical protein Cme02nite_53950 [Catellatospora methionotrophica]|uniref:Uncharacterized protein n=1 Tax=Catellatospora methionotrophica TaxID=121620 RepID=A0A8J3L9Z3_9ACTN|nr:hypothetical protein Cme02nite_53950 [Catellatospora methionotrophica]
MAQQGGLAAAEVAVQEQGSAHPGGRTGLEFGDRLLLTGPPAQPWYVHCRCIYHADSVTYK